MSVKRIAVVGAGIMGRGIAYASAIVGYDTALYDVDTEVLDQAVREIESIAQKGVERGKLDAKAAGAMKLSAGADLGQACGGAQLVIEAAPENIRLKLELFENLDRLCDPGTFYATNTSSLSVTEMAAATNRAGQVCGMHFFNPVHRMRLIEIVCGLETSEDTIAVAEEVAATMGKETVVINESPGFITTRVNALIGNEAFRMMQESVATPEDIDRALKLGLNHPMGPLELMDLVGLDTRLKRVAWVGRPAAACTTTWTANRCRAAAPGARQRRRNEHGNPDKTRAPLHRWRVAGCLVGTDLRGDESLARRAADPVRRGRRRRRRSCGDSSTCHL
jgi:3-hydroxybutyryl-CoA dehydrogenase